MTTTFEHLLTPAGATPRYLFFGGKGGVGKTTMAAATATWFADQGLATTIVSTDPTVSLSAVFGQPIGGRTPAPLRAVPNLCGLNINPADARGAFQQRLSDTVGRLGGSLGPDFVSTPCADEMAAFDQFVTFLDQPHGDVVVFDTAPTGKTLRELAMPFDWAGFLQDQIEHGKEMARLMNLGDEDFGNLERDKQRYETALSVLRDRTATIFTLVVVPERLPIEETASAIDGLDRLGIPVQALVVNQVISADVIAANAFLDARARLQARYLDEIEARFADTVKVRVPLLDRDVSDPTTLRQVARILYQATPTTAPRVVA